MIRSKYEAFDAFKLYKVEVKNQLERRIEILRPDRGSDNFNQDVFIGYAHNNKAYRLLDNKSGVVVESKDVEFFKDKFSKDIENSNPIKFPSTSQENVRPSLVIEEPRRNTRSRKDKNLGDDFYSFD
uniref:Retroviral polymerase SH3-like domain-containing protein n=1 Tax=Lactuca sativa TaxID=4236 RepID=A0A9R1VU07_LACSA|nr:hypothetical protein LSAT_V11C400163750 [Lactuca sativa]